MSLFGKWNTLLLAATLLAVAGGCSMDSGPMDEEKEPHYVLGKSRVNAMDYAGAIEAFDESLEVNPHSAQAHYQLAILYDNQDSVADPAAAIYHYRQCLKYDPSFPNADAIKGRIDACKQKLAADVLQLPSTPAAQQQLEKLTEENRRLHDQLAQWQAYYAAQQAAARTNPPAPQYNYSPQPTYSPQPQVTSVTPDDVTPQSATTTSTSGASTAASQHRYSASARSDSNKYDSRTSRPHTHVVLIGETLASIARNHGISLQALEEANPYVNPKKLKAGQVLNLPVP